MGCSRFIRWKIKKGEAGLLLHNAVWRNSIQKIVVSLHLVDSAGKWWLWGRSSALFFLFPLHVNENKFHMTYTKIRNNNIYNYFMFSTVGLKTQIVFLSPCPVKLKHWSIMFCAIVWDVPHLPPCMFLLIARKLWITSWNLTVFIARNKDYDDLVCRIHCKLCKICFIFWFWSCISNKEKWTTVHLIRNVVCIFQ